MQFHLVMMKMPCKFQAQSQVLEVRKGHLVHLKLKQEEEEGAGAGAGAGAGVPAP